MTATSQKFIEERARLHEARRMESQLSFDLMVEFLKMRQGEVSGDDFAKLFHEGGMPYPAKMYVSAREKAGVSIKKALNKHANSKTRWKQIKDQWRFLVENTPPERKPKIIVSAHEETVLESKAVEDSKPGATAENPRYLAAVIKVPPDLSTVKTEDLLTELRRRRDEARAVLEALDIVLPEKKTDMDPK